MGKVDRLHNRVEPLAALFLALGIVLANSPNPARRPSIPPPPYTIMSLYGHIGSILNEDVLPPPPPFSYLRILFIYGLQLRISSQNRN